MTVTTRTVAPSYRIFEPDALDQIYARTAATDPIMGGIANAFGIANRMNKEGSQNQYLASQERFNKMAAALDMMEMQEKRKTEALKIGGTLIGKGEDPTKVIGSDSIYSNPSDSLLPGLMRGLIAAKTVGAANGGGGGGGTKEYDTIAETSRDIATGREITTTKRRAPGAIDSTSPGGPKPDPSKSTAVPSNVNKNVAQDKQVEARAKAALGGNAVLAAQQNGATLWVNPNKRDSAGKPMTVTFDSTGKQVR